MRLVQLEDKFCLPVKHIKNKVVIETIKDIENNIKKLDLLTKNNIRNSISAYLNNYLIDNKPLTHFERNLLIKLRPHTIL